MGRFMTPDWSDKPQAVPYANFVDPQSLDLYAYVRNNPVSRTDIDGHCGPWCWIGWAVGTIVSAVIIKYHYDAEEAAGYKQAYEKESELMGKFILDPNNPVFDTFDADALATSMRNDYFRAYGKTIDAGSDLMLLIDAGENIAERKAGQVLVDKAKDAAIDAAIERLKEKEGFPHCIGCEPPPKPKPSVEAPEKRSDPSPGASPAQPQSAPPPPPNLQGSQPVGPIG